jgi:hypothetical protein
MRKEKRDQPYRVVDGLERYARPAHVTYNEQDKRIEWALEDGRIQTAAKDTTATGNLIADFVNLAVTPNRFKADVERWGVLYLCRHNLPATHNPSWPARVLADSGQMITARNCALQYSDRETGGRKPASRKKSNRADLPTNWESLEVWERFARQAYHLLNIADSLHAGRTGSKDDWVGVLQRYEIIPSELHYQAPVTSESRLGQSVPEDMLQVSQVTNEWLRLGNVGLHLNWASSRRPTIAWGGQTLFAVLAIQLMVAVSHAHALVRCSECPQFYVPDRLPRTDEGGERVARNYCPACGRRAAVRNKVRERRGRK